MYIPHTIVHKNCCTKKITHYARKINAKKEESVLVYKWLAFQDIHEKYAATATLSMCLNKEVIQ